MHEWALAESVINTVVDEIRLNNIRKVTKVDVKVGELQQIDLDIFRFALENVMKTYELSLESKAISIEIEKNILRCEVCGKTWSFGDAGCMLGEDEAEAIHFIPEIAHVYIRCPECSSPDFEIVKGRGVWIKTIEGER